MAPELDEPINYMFSRDSSIYIFQEDSYGSSLFHVANPKLSMKWDLTLGSRNRQAG
jgi:hypothetical protein